MHMRKEPSGFVTNKTDDHSLKFYIRLRPGMGIGWVSRAGVTPAAAHIAGLACVGKHCYYYSVGKQCYYYSVGKHCYYCSCSVLLIGCTRL